MSAGFIAHWDDAESGRAEAGQLGGRWTDLGGAAGSRTVGLDDGERRETWVKEKRG